MIEQRKQLAAIPDVDYRSRSVPASRGCRVAGYRTRNYSKKNIGRLIREGEMLRAVNRQAIHRRKCSALRSEIHDFERVANVGHKTGGSADVQSPTQACRSRI